MNLDTLALAICIGSFSALAGCGGNACDDAADKVESCGAKNAGDLVDKDAECSGRTECVAGCVADADCDSITGTDPISSASFAKCTADCK